MQPNVELLAYQPAACSDRSTTLTLLVRLRAPRVEMRRKPCLNVGLCIDRSGSMSGLPMQRALEAGKHLVQSLDPTDYVSVVAFDSSVEVPTQCRQVGLDSRPIVDRLQALFARGGTALHQGWVESCRQVDRGVANGRLSRVLLLSDGQANVGLVDTQRIAAQVADWQRRGISTTTIGLGEGYNEDLLSAMARAGNGNFYNVRTPEDIASTFEVEMHGMFSTFGQAVSLGVEAQSGVEVLQVVNPLERTEKGRYKLADLVHGNPIDVVLELLVPAMLTEHDLCRFRLAYTDVQTGQRHHTHHTLRLPVVPAGQLSEFPLNPEVLQKRALQLSARTLQKAVALIDLNDTVGAKAALQSGLDLLSQAGTSAELADTANQLRQLLQSLERGAVGSVRKQATYYSGSVSLSSISLSGGIREFMALPAEERTPEKLNELMLYGGSQGADG
jgi:Ca-activated chloride channel family protein